MVKIKMNKLNKILLVGVIILLNLLMFGCSDGSTSSDIEKKQTEKTLLEMQNEVGMPRIDNFFEKKMAKQIFELRDDSGLITYAYMVNLNGKFIYLGRCVGFGLPYSVQYTNPQKIEYRSSSYSQVIAQADPNGLYMPDGLSATWLMLINEETGAQEIIYTEPSIVVTQSKLPKRLIESWSLPEGY